MLLALSHRSFLPTNWTIKYQRTIRHRFNNRVQIARRLGLCVPFAWLLSPDYVQLLNLNIFPIVEFIGFILAFLRGVSFFLFAHPYFPNQHRRWHTHSHTHMHTRARPLPHNFLQRLCPDKRAYVCACAWFEHRFVCCSAALVFINIAQCYGPREPTILGVWISFIDPRSTCTRRISYIHT